MIITGAMFLQSLLMHSTEGTIPLWIGVQKGAAAVLVGRGDYAGIAGADRLRHGRLRRDLGDHRLGVLVAAAAMKRVFIAVACI